MRLRNFFAVILLVFVVTLTAFAKDRKMTTEELVAKHLQSIGTDQVRAAVRSRVLQGQVVFSEVISHQVNIPGNSMMLSEGNKFKCAYQFGAPQYPGEQFVFDGNKEMVGMIDPTSRSNLGAFLYSQEVVLREGLFGGALSTAWPLLDLKSRAAKLKYEGLHKVEGRDLYDLVYIPKKSGGNGELIIHLYFDPTTFHHVMTIYRVTLQNPGGSATNGTDQITQTLEERFGDFQTQDGLTLPRHWTVQYHVNPESKPQLFQWDSSFISVVQNKF